MGLIGSALGNAIGAAAKVGAQTYLEDMQQKRQENLARFQEEISIAREDRAEERALSREDRQYQRSLEQEARAEQSLIAREERGLSMRGDERAQIRAETPIAIDRDTGEELNAQQVKNRRESGAAGNLVFPKIEDINNKAADDEYRKALNAYRLGVLSSKDAPKPMTEYQQMQLKGSFDTKFNAGLKGVDENTAQAARDIAERMSDLTHNQDGLPLVSGARVASQSLSMARQAMNNAKIATDKRVKDEVAKEPDATSWGFKDSGYIAKRRKEIQAEELGKAIESIKMPERAAERRSDSPKTDRLNNPGAVVDLNTGEIKDFATREEGEKALRADLAVKFSGRSNKLKGPLTPANLAETWSPAREKGNSFEKTANYGKFIAKAVGVGVDDVIPDTPENREEVARAITAFEAGGELKAEYLASMSKGKKGSKADPAFTALVEEISVKPSRTAEEIPMRATHSSSPAASARNIPGLTPAVKGLASLAVNQFVNPEAARIATERQKREDEIARRYLKK